MNDSQSALSAAEALPLSQRPHARFYVLPEQAEIEALLRVLGRLLERVEAEGLKASIRCADHEQALWLDEALWRVPESALLPHYYLPHQSLEPYHEQCRLVLLTAPERAMASDVVVDLSVELRGDVPKGCRRVLELVWAGNREAARSRYRYYQQLGFRLEMHQVSDKALWGA